MQAFSLVVAMDDTRGIGKDGDLPWHLPPDLKHFREVTTTTNTEGKMNAVVMGRITWESLPDRFKPLPGRINVVLSRNHNLDLPDGVILADSLATLGSTIKSHPLFDQLESVFVIGGQQIYDQAVRMPQCQRIFATHIQGSFDCDAFFPEFCEEFSQVSSDSLQDHEGLKYHFAEYERS